MSTVLRVFSTHYNAVSPHFFVCLFIKCIHVSTWNTKCFIFLHTDILVCWYIQTEKALYRLQNYNWWSPCYKCTVKKNPTHKGKNSYKAGVVLQFWKDLKGTKTQGWHLEKTIENKIYQFKNQKGKLYNNLRPEEQVSPKDS